MDDKTREVLELCEKASRQKPISLKALRNITGFSAAWVRNVIADLREGGHRICSGANGYWVAKDETDYKKFRTYYMAKINKRLARIKAMDNNVPNQIEMGAEC